MDKNELRKKLLKLNINDIQNKKASQIICKAFLSLSEYKNAKCVFCYIGKSTEIDTTIIIQKVLNDEKILCVPYCTIGEKGEKIMLAKQIFSPNELKLGSYGILEPSQNAKTISPQQIDIVAVPCLAADKNGARLGYGGGYYDRFLPKLQESTAKIALCREAFLQADGIIPMHEHDVKMDMVISEKILNKSKK